MKTEQELHELVGESILLLKNLFLNSKDPLRVPETDIIMEAIYCNFFINSITSIPKQLRHAYIENRIDKHGDMLKEVVKNAWRITEDEELQYNNETMH